MFTIRMYQFNKKVISTKQPNVAGTPFSCEMKTSSSILFPVVEIRSGNSGRSLPLFNYAYIDEFKRYYWIDDITYDIGIWSISMHCDALASFQYDILQSNQYVVRSSSEYDNEIADTMYLTKTANYNTEYVEIKYPGIGGNPNYVYTDDPGSGYSTEEFFDQSLTAGYFVIGVVGNNTAGVSYYLFSI